MKIERRDVDGIAVVSIAGVIKLGESARQFSEYLGTLLEEDLAGVILDMRSIDAVDSTGLGELVAYLQRFGEQKKKLVLLRPPQRVMKLLELTKLDEVFPIFDEEPEALRYVQAS